MEICRWGSLRTLRVYLDAAAATAPLLARKLEQPQFAALADRANEDFPVVVLSSLKDALPELQV